MKHDLSTLRKVIEKSLGKTISATTDMEKVVLSFSKHQITLSGKSHSIAIALRTHTIYI